MIAEIGITTIFGPFILISMAVAMVVLRASGSRVFFDVVGTFQANKLISDAQASATVLESLYMDSLMAIQEAGAEIGAIFIDAVDNVIPLTQEIENARIEFEKFVDNVDEAKELERQLQDIGLAFGFTADKAFQAGARMAQLSGVLGGQGSTAVGTEMGMLFGAISGMETEAAMQRLINLNQQTQFMTKNLENNMTAQEKANRIRLDTIRVLDQLNTIENRSAATMQQITFVMNQFASQAHLTNESIAAMAAMSATLIEAGEEQGKGGRALRMIYARLGANTNGARDAIERLGIAVFDTNGDMRPFSQLLGELAEEYRTLTGRQQQQMAQDIAGNRHYTRLIKLLENVDRVRELELEGLLAQFPARDELQRRLDSEIFQYEQSQAAIENYSASFGNALLPALTSANNQQALFMKNLTALVEGPLGGAASGFIMLSRLLGQFAGPMFTSIIAVKNLQIALQTQHVVMRALNGETIAAVGGMQAHSVQLNINKLQQESLTTGVTKNQKVMLKQRAVLIQNINKLSKRRLALQGTNQAQGHVTRKLKAAVQALQALNIELDETTDREVMLGTSAGIAENALLQQNMALTKNTMMLGGLGSAMMMFGQNDKAMRLGMLLTTGAMAMQMYQVYKSIVAMTAKDTIDKKNVISLNLLTISNVKAAASMLSMARVTSATKAAMISLRSATLALYRSIAIISKIGIVLLVLDAIIAPLADKLGLFNDSFDDMQVNALSTGIADTALVMEYLSMSTSEANTQLGIVTGKYNAIKDSTDELSKTQKTAYEAEILALQTVLDMQAVQKVNIDDLNGSYQDYIDAQKTVQEIAKDDKSFIGDLQEIALGASDFLDKHTGMAGGGLADFLSGGKKSEREKALKIMEDFANANVDFMAFVGDKQFETVAEMESAYQDYVNTVENFGKDDIMGNVGASIRDTTDAVHEFNNAREEMFFGFSSDKLTGDLIRQVQQQGVETLITSTEVIMHNNFNGMTVPEVADQIIAEIESRGNLRNYNMATS